MNEAEMDQSNQLVNLLIYLNQKQKKIKIKKRYLWKCVCSLWNSRNNS